MEERNGCQDKDCTTHIPGGQWWFIFLSCGLFPLLVQIKKKLWSKRCWPLAFLRNNDFFFFPIGYIFVSSLSLVFVIEASSHEEEKKKKSFDCITLSLVKFLSCFSSFFTLWFLQSLLPIFSNIITGAIRFFCFFFFRVSSFSKLILQKKISCTLPRSMISWWWSMIAVPA